MRPLVGSNWIPQPYARPQVLHTSLPARCTHGAEHQQLPKPNLPRKDAMSCLCRSAIWRSSSNTGHSRSLPKERTSSATRLPASVEMSAPSPAGYCLNASLQLSMLVFSRLGASSLSASAVLGVSDPSASSWLSGMEMPHRVNIAAAPSSSSNARFCSLLLAGLQSLPTAPSRVRTRCAPRTASPSGPRAQPARKGPGCRGNGKNCSTGDREPPRSDSNWCRANSSRNLLTSLTMTTFCF
mmetsp:Transcript_8374/g.22719  ORF Transcript_8374/g.22719 Transcript_8374/m.22719 type:complete len:240 (-) Transcript_8374:911-1630(-)